MLEKYQLEKLRLTQVEGLCNPLKHKPTHYLFIIFKLYHLKVYNLIMELPRGERIDSTL